MSIRDYIKIVFLFLRVLCVRFSGLCDKSNFNTEFAEIYAKFAERKPALRNQKYFENTFFSRAAHRINAL